MITAINEGEELLYRPLNPVVKKALEDREDDKNSIINRFPFLRISCLQKLSFNESTKSNQTNNLISYKDKIGCNKSVIEGFVFEMREDFDSSYSQKNQKIGTELKTLDNITIENPRRVPPPQLTGFTATNGDAAGFFTTAKLQFTCHSLEQLEFLTPFLLHPGNTIFCEWGYSDKNTTMNMPLMSFDDLENFLNSSIVKVENIDDDGECTDDNTETENPFFDELENRIKENSGNYEYVPGMITNFDFSINENFGYDVSVDIISISQAQLQISPSTPGEKVENKKEELSEEEKQKLEEQKKRLVKIRGFALKAFINTVEQEKWKFREGSTNSTYSKSISTIFKSTPKSNNEYYDDIINLPVKGGYKKYIRLGRLLPLIGNPIDKKSALRKFNKYIKSFDKDVLIFNEKIPTAREIQVSDQDNLISDPIKMQSGFLPQDSSYDTIVTDVKISNKPNVTDIGDLFSTEERNFLKKIEFQFFKPYKFEIKDNGETKGDIRNMYISYDFFKSIYLADDTNNRDILTSILNKISKATGGFYNDTVAEIYDTKCKKQKTKITNTNNRCIRSDDKRKTYTFNFNQKESIITNLNFDYALEGLFRDQVFAQSISAESNDELGKKMSSLLFENQENNIQLTDYRNERVKSIRESFPNENFEAQNDGGDTTLTGSTVQDLYSADPTEFLTVYTTRTSELNDLPLYENPGGFRFTEDGLSVNTANGVYTVVLDDESSADIAASEASAATEVGVFTDLFLLCKFPVPLIDDKKDLYFDAIKAEEEKNQSEDKETPCSNQDTPLAPTGITIQLPGLGGFQPLEFFKTKGLTSLYDNRGEFVVYSVTHTVTRDDWTTQIEGRFRVKPSEDDGDSE
jgi:hypothetical protein